MLNTNTRTIQAEGFISFPCHRSEKQLFERGVRGKISCKCPKCGDFAIFDLTNRISYPADAARGAVHRLKQPA